MLRLKGGIWMQRSEGQEGNQLIGNVAVEAS